MKYLFMLLVLISSLYASAKNDSLVFNNGNTMVGEIKSMDRGVFQIETDYSDSDFKIEWDKIYAINTTTSFLITLTDGTKYYGSLIAVPDSTINIRTIDNKVIECDLAIIVGSCTRVKNDNIR